MDPLMARMLITLNALSYAIETNWDGPPRLREIPLGGEAERIAFVENHIEPWHAIAVAVVGKGTARHELLQRLGADQELDFIIPRGVQFAKGKSKLVVYRHRLIPDKNHKDLETEVYEGKWTFKSMKEWLMDVAYPVVNRLMDAFPVAKYFDKNPFGLVLIARPQFENALYLDHASHMLDPFAKKYKHRLKFTFLPSTPTTEEFYDRFGVLTSNELVLVEKPGEQRRFVHGNVPLPPKFRLENVTALRLEEFFAGYDAGTLKQYHKSASRSRTPLIRDGIRELAGWDFSDVVFDPTSSVLVLFVSAKCGACAAFEPTFIRLSRHVKHLQQRRPNPFPNLTLARMDHTVNEHPVQIEGTPALFYWSRGVRKWKRELGKPDAKSFDTLVSFLEEAIAEEEDTAANSEIQQSKLADARFRQGTRPAKAMLGLQDSDSNESCDLSGGHSTCFQDDGHGEPLMDDVR